MTSDYYPFGLSMQGRTSQQEGYRYGFQGQEEDKETGWVEYKYRMHNPNIGRFFAIDPLAPKYPFYSPYAFSGNRVIDMVELEGLEPAPTGKEQVGDIEQADGSTWGWTGDEWAYSDPGVTVIPKHGNTSQGVKTKSLKYSGRLGYDVAGSLGSEKLSAAIEGGEQYRKEVGLWMKGITYSLLATNAIKPVVTASTSTIRYIASGYKAMFLHAAVQGVNQSYIATHRHGWTWESVGVGFSNIDAIDAFYAPLGGVGNTFGSRLLMNGSGAVTGGFFDLKTSNVPNAFSGGLQSPLLGNKRLDATIADTGVGLAGSAFSATSVTLKSTINIQSSSIVEYRHVQSNAVYIHGWVWMFGEGLKYSAPSAKSYLKDPVIQQGVLRDFNTLGETLFKH